MSELNLSKLIVNQPIPKGFALAAESGDDLIIRYKPTGMGCVNVFLFVWLFIWFFLCLMFLGAFVSVFMGAGEPISLWASVRTVLLGVICWGAEILVGWSLVYALFCRKTFHLGQSSLTIKTKVLRLKWCSVIERDSIERFVQVENRASRTNSVSSWGLKVEGEQSATLIYQQPYEKSHWLGSVLAQWADVDFVEAPKQKTLVSYFRD